MYAFALRNTTVNHIRGCVVKILYPTLPRFQSKMAIVWDRSMAGEPGKRHYVRKEGMVLYSAVSSPLDRSKRFTLSSPGRPVHSDTVLGFSWKHSSYAAIAQRLFTHISTTVYSQVLIYIQLSRLRRREVKENAQTSKR